MVILNRFNFWLAIVVSIIIVTSGTGAQFAAHMLVNWSLMHVLKTPLCDPDWYVCKKEPHYYPPQVWKGNKANLTISREALELATRLDATAIGAQEHLIELEYAFGDDQPASNRFEQLLHTGQLRTGILRDGFAPFYFLLSYKYEKSGDVYEAAQQIQRGLQLADFELPPSREFREVKRLSRLIRVWSTKQSQPGNKFSSTPSNYQSVLYSACAGDWNISWEKTQLLAGLPSNLTAEQEEVVLRLLALQWRWSGNTLDETRWLSKAGEVQWDQWSIGDPYLWLANELDAFDPYACQEGARRIYMWYSDVHPDSAQGLYLDGLTLLRRRDFVGARQFFQEAYQRGPSHVASARGLAITYELTGSFEKAVWWYKRAIELWPNHGEYHARLARVLHLLGYDQEAQLEFEKAITLSPDSEEFLVWAGCFYVDLGRIHPAREMFESALILNPNNPYATQALIEIGYGHEKN